MCNHFHGHFLSKQQKPKDLQSTFDRGVTSSSTRTVPHSSLRFTTEFSILVVTDENDDACHGYYNIQTWHKILSHCNFGDMSKLEMKGMKGMKIKVK